MAEALLGLTWLGTLLAILVHACCHALAVRARGWRLRRNRLPKGPVGMAW